MPEPHTLSEIVGPWKDPDFGSSLIARCREAWDKPIESLTNQELATCIRQKIAIEYLLPLAKKRIADHIDDETEFYDGELASAIQDIKA